MAGLVFTVVGTVAGVAGAYFAWVAVRPRLRSKGTRPRPVPSVPKAVPGLGGFMGFVYDVFISYSHDDFDWVSRFAERLESEGLRVARDEVVLKPGDVLTHAIEQAIRDSAHGILVFSPASVASGWVQQEYAALMQRSIRTGYGSFLWSLTTLSCRASRRPGTTPTSGMFPWRSTTVSSPRSLRPCGADHSVRHVS